jgi:transposase
VADLIEQADRLQVIFFPPACPDLKPQEHVWERARDAVSHNHTYRQFQVLVDNFESYLNETAFSTQFMDALTPLGLGVF